MDNKIKFNGRVIVTDTSGDSSNKTELYDSVLIKEVFGLSANPAVSEVYTYLITNGTKELENIWNAALESASKDDMNIEDSVYEDGEYILLEYNNGISIRYSIHPIMEHDTDEVIKAQKA